MDTDDALRQKFFSVACHLDEKQRRLLAAAEAKKPRIWRHQSNGRCHRCQPSYHYSRRFANWNRRACWRIASGKRAVGRKKSV